MNKFTSMPKETFPLVRDNGFCSGFFIMNELFYLKENGFDKKSSIRRSFIE